MPPAATPEPDVDPTVPAVVLLAALCAAGSLVARVSPTPSWATDTLAATSVGPLTLLAVVGWCWSSGNRRMVGMAVVGGVVTASVWALLLQQIDVDPTGVGLIGARGTPVVLNVGAAVGAVLAGAGIARLPRWGTVGRSSWAAAAAITIAALLLGRFGSSIAVVVSLVAAAAIVAVRSTASTSGQERRPGSTSTVLVVGAAVGVIVTAPATLAFIGDHSTDRRSVVDGALRITGPIFVVWTWVVLLGACVGVTAVAAVASARRRSLSALSDAGALVVIGALTVLSRTATTTNLVNARRDGGDQFFYHVTANLLANGRGFIHPVPWAQDGFAEPSALHGPAFPMALSVWSRLGGTTYFDHQLASVVLGVPQVIFGVMLAYLIAGRRTAIVAAVLLLVYPNIWVTDGSIWVEGMMAGLTTAATWMMFRWRTSLRVSTIAWVGVLIGAAALTRGEAVLMTVLLVLPMVATSALGRRAQFHQLAVCAAAFVAVIAPWAIYNATRFEQAVALSTNSNEVIYYANCPDSYYGPKVGYWSFACQVRHRETFGDMTGDEAQRATAWRDLGLEYASDHIERVPAVLAARVGRQWELYRPLQNADFGFVEGRPRDVLRAGLAMYSVMMALAVVGTVALRRRRVPVWPLWSHAAMVTLTALYAYGNLRFRAPFEPILCVMAAVGVVALFDRYRTPQLESDVPHP